MMKLMEAKQRIEALRLDGPSIKCEVRRWAGQWKTEFTVWDGNKHHTGQSLEAVIRAAEEANTRNNQDHQKAETFFGETA